MSNGQQNTQRPQEGCLSLSRVMTGLTGLLVGLTLFTFSAADKQGRDSLVGLALGLGFLVLLAVMTLRLPILSGLWKSFQRTFLKKSGVERFLWTSAFVGLIVYGLLMGLRALGS